MRIARSHLFITTVTGTPWGNAAALRGKRLERGDRGGINHEQHMIGARDGLAGASHAFDFDGIAGFVAQARGVDEFHRHTVDLDRSRSRSRVVPATGVTMATS